MLIKSQSEVRLHTGRSVHFHPSQTLLFNIFQGSGSETTLGPRVPLRTSCPPMSERLQNSYIILCAILYNKFIVDFHIAIKIIY